MVEIRRKLPATEIEKQIQLAYQREFGGKIEYPTKFGKIDLLTDTTIFEFKQFKQYKAALGQLLAYNLCVPQNRLVAVLFGCINVHRQDVELLMGKYGINVEFIN